MLETLKQVLVNQFEAALCTLNACADKCPDEMWNARVANYKFCQVVFHTLFYADYYLGQSGDGFREQPFHQANTAFFRDYEEFEDRAPRLLYDKPSIRGYLGHCRAKALDALKSETAASLAARAGFERLQFPRAELYVYNTRHIQHHAAQLILRLRLDVQLDVPWVKSGWREL